MKDQIIKVMKDHLRRVENDLRTWKLTELQKIKEAEEASKMVYLLAEQFTLLNNQVKGLESERD